MDYKGIQSKFIDFMKFTWTSIGIREIHVEFKWNPWNSLEIHVKLM
jgi:hypothetical protein